MTEDELKSLREKAIQLSRVNREIDRIRSYVLHTSPNLDGMPHGGQNVDAMAAYVANVEDWLNEKTELAGKMMEEIISLSEEIMKLQKPTADIIWKYYAEGKNIRQIAIETHYSRRQTYNKFNEGKRRLLK